MILHVTLALLGAAAVLGQTCNYRNDALSPFYWKGYENICTKSMCETYPWLKCDVAREYIMDQAYAHWPEDIAMEIEYMGKYFNTLIPRPNNQLPYTCKGVCQDGARQLQLERIFTDLTLPNEQGLMETKRWMCIVIGPNIYYQQCGGKCKMPFGGGGDSFCVPDVTVSIDIWVFCPGANPGCHKVRFDVPLSCSCKKMTCRKALPPPATFKPVIPPEPKNWKPANPIDPQGTPLGPINPSYIPGDPSFGSPNTAFDPFNDPSFGLDPMGGMPLGAAQGQGLPAGK